MVLVRWVGFLESAYWALKRYGWKRITSINYDELWIESMDVHHG